MVTAQDIKHLKHITTKVKCKQLLKGKTVEREVEVWTFESGKNYDPATNRLLTGENKKGQIYATGGAKVILAEAE